MRRRNKNKYIYYKTLIIQPSDACIKAGETLALNVPYNYPIAIKFAELINSFNVKIKINVKKKGFYHD